MITPNNTTLEGLKQFARENGITICRHAGGPKGLWIPTRQIISLQQGLGETNQRCTLAHELGHAMLGHTVCGDTRDEYRANSYAARLLISPVEYALTEQLYEHPQQIAEELGVTQFLLKHWQQMYRCQKQAA